MGYEGCVLELLACLHVVAVVMVIKCFYEVSIYYYFIIILSAKVSRESIPDIPI
jgi:hypothetical protein